MAQNQLKTTLSSLPLAMGTQFDLFFEISPTTLKAMAQEGEQGSPPLQKVGNVCGLHMSPWRSGGLEHFFLCLYKRPGLWPKPADFLYTTGYGESPNTCVHAGPVQPKCKANDTVTRAECVGEVRFPALWHPAIPTIEHHPWRRMFALQCWVSYPMAWWCPTLVRCLDRRGHKETAWRGINEAVHLWNTLGLDAQGPVKGQAS